MTQNSKRMQCVNKKIHKRNMNMEILVERCLISLVIAMIRKERESSKNKVFQ